MAFIIVIPGSAPASTPMTRPVDHHGEVEWFENIAKTREKQLPSAHNVTP